MPVIGNTEKLKNPTYIWVVYQRSDKYPVEELPITGVYSTKQAAVEAAHQYIEACEDFETPVQKVWKKIPQFADESEIVWQLRNGELECIVYKMVLDY